MTHREGKQPQSTQRSQRKELLISRFQRERNVALRTLRSLRLLSRSVPELPARDCGALRERGELGPDDIRIHAARSDVNAEAAVDAGHDLVAADEVRVARDP